MTGPGGEGNMVPLSLDLNILWITRIFKELNSGSGTGVPVCLCLIFIMLGVLSIKSLCKRAGR